MSSADNVRTSISRTPLALGVTLALEFGLVLGLGLELEFGLVLELEFELGLVLGLLAALCALALERAL